MSALTVDALAILIAGHDTDSGTYFLAEDGSCTRRCRCGFMEQTSSRDPWLGLDLAHNRHLAEVIVTAQKIANRSDDSIGADELAEQYYDRAGRILNITGFDGCAARMGVEPFWHIDTDLIVTMLNAGRMTVVEAGVYELRGLPVRGHEVNGDLGDDTPVFALVIQ